jgi:hypothetical protein
MSLLVRSGDCAAFSGEAAAGDFCGVDAVPRSPARVHWLGLVPARLGLVPALLLALGPGPGQLVAEPPPRRLATMCQDNGILVDVHTDSPA